MRIFRLDLILKVHLFFLTFSLINFSKVNACSRILSNKDPDCIACARSLDWHEPMGEELRVFPRKANLDGTTTYASLCIVAKNYDNAYLEGINEKGFAAHLLYMEDTVYEKRDISRPSISYAEWVRYYLDSCSSVQNALDLALVVQITPVMIHKKIYPVHLAIEDAHGDSAILEFIDGKLVIHHGRQFTVLTNEPTYTKQLENLGKYLPFEDFRVPGGIEPKDRFVRALYYLQHVSVSKNDPISSMFCLIATVSVPWQFRDEDSTLWTSVMDLSRKKYYFRSIRTDSNFFIDMNMFDLSKNKLILSLDPNFPGLYGDASTALRPTENF